MPTTRRLLAFLSACGIAASTLVYIESYYGATVGSILNWVVLLGIGAAALHLPIYVIEKDRMYFTRGFARDMPSWVVPSVKLLGLIVLAHLVWSSVESDFAIPIIKDGQYVLDSRGRILRVLAEKEYLKLKEGELRFFAALLISFPFASMTYWWFRKSRRSGDASSS